ncbi:Cytochrome P450 [Raineyella antarctica]|uniref:Cytochrome P450 n=1 Tax=Raineyella antarctica TaxID=1577474 RepID=A0A1G6HPY5_9ACTN|nr:cytochrome P450 [Raineyella antarctica]SDB96261.1 Cytochrome P450 [Raineyella antarctica]
MVAVADLRFADTATLDELLAARGEGRMVRSPRGWEVLGYEDSLEALRHPQLLRAKLFLTRADKLGLGPGFARSYMERMLNTQEGEQRTHLRTPTAKVLAPRVVRKLAEEVHTIVHRLLDEVADPSDVDLLNEVCWRLPPAVYCVMFGAPMEHAGTIARLSDSLLGPILSQDSSRIQELEDAHHEAFEFVIRQIEDRRGHLGEDFTSFLVEQEMSGYFTRQELYDTGVNILEASVDNTVHQGAEVIGRLLERPDDWRRVLADRDLVRNAIEEVTRMWPRFRTHMRYAAEDIELFGEDLSYDDIVFVNVEAAHHDERVFEDPLTFDVARPVHPGPLVYGQGQYSCLGQHLARLEMSELLNAILDRYPHARLIEPFQEHAGPFVREATRLRVSLTGE